MTVVLDCNIWVTLALSRQINFLYLLKKNAIQLAACQELYDEISTVLNRGKFKKYLSKLDVEQLKQIYRILTTNFILSGIELVVSDTKDNYLFALCKVSEATFFVTGDKLLLAEKDCQQTKIISFADFKLLLP